VDAPPVLEFAEHVFDLVAFSVEHSIMRCPSSKDLEHAA
jgi:hypothetical protein